MCVSRLHWCLRWCLDNAVNGLQWHRRPLKMHWRLELSDWTSEKALPQKLSQPKQYWLHWTSAAVTILWSETASCSVFHKLIFQERKSAVSCTHQLSMVILVQNKYFFSPTCTLKHVFTFLCNTYWIFGCLARCIFQFWLLLSFHSFVFFLVATWWNWFTTDNHLWRTASLDLSQNIALLRALLLPNCQKPVHYIYFDFDSTVFCFQRLILACLDRGGASPCGTLG